MAQYFDRHGTEIREGDKIRGSDGIDWTIIDRQNYLPEQLAGDVVLSRADGTLRRVRPDEPSSRAIIEQRPELSQPIFKEQIDALVAARLAHNPYSRMTINGFEVPPPMIMKSVGISEKVRHFGSIEEMNAAYGWNMKSPPPMQVFGIDWAVDALAEQIESACRALSRPTLADRFAAFKTRVTKLLSDKRVTFVFDCDAANGPVVKVWCDALPACEWVAFTEQATNEQIIAHLNGWAKRIGQEYLRGKVVVGKK